MWGSARHFPGRLWRQEKFDTVTGYMTGSGDLRSHAPVHIHPMPLINALILAVDMDRCSEIAGSAGSQSWRHCTGAVTTTLMERHIEAEVTRMMPATTRPVAPA
jgi:hypothetical protein